MKYIILAFDDGRKDQYTNAFRILKKYGLVGSIYVTTGFVDGDMPLENVFLSSKEGAMTIDEIKECNDYGIEIGSHSDTHINDTNDILVSLNKLKKWNIIKNDETIGFASPSSDICLENISTIDPIKNKLSYVRSGTQARRNGLWYSMIYFFNTKVNSNILFWILNKKSIFNIYYTPKCIPSVTIRNTTHVKNIIHLIKKMPDNYAAVLLFHSIKEDDYNGFQDAWCYRCKDFEDICKFLCENDHVKVSKLADIVRKVDVNGLI